LPTDMTDTEIQIAIAECCGWIPHAWQGGTRWLKDGQCAYPPPYDGDSPGIPDYVNSLDEMHEAEKVIPAEYWYNYSEHLFDVAGLGDPHDNPNLNYGEMRPLLQLTARQRAEAFLRTLNKWKEPSHV
jgi:hypothetical protein